MPIDPLPHVSNNGPPPDPPSDSPSGFRADAEAAFVDMVKAAGRTAYKMPTSCELYIRQYLGAFEAERAALVEALRRGVPDRIDQHPGRDGYADFLRDEAAKLVKEAKLAPGVAWGAVACWAAGLGKPSGSTAARPVARSVEVPQPKPQAEEKIDTLQILMTLIATAGGFFGGFFGNGVSLLLAVLSTISILPPDPVDKNKPAPPPVVKKDDNPILYTVYVIGMAIGGVAGGLGAGAGWMMGRGNTQPWVGFSAAGGAAFTTGAIVSTIAGPGLSAAVAILVTSFGGAYAAASSGGYRT